MFEFAQKLGNKSVYSTRKDVIPISTSERMAYRHLRTLQDLGFIVKSNRGHFVINRIAVSQPISLREKLLPSLEALKKARKFGRYYNDSDIEFTRNNIRNKLITLDYKAWELTKFQYPSELYMYVEDVDMTA